MDIKDLRREYLHDDLTSNNLLNNPHKQFQLWLDDAVASGITDPTAMTISTVDASGQPSQRIVLLKEADDNGFVFYTNYGSRKAQEIADNDKVSILFPWLPLERQVKIQGVASRVSQKESFDYFSSRPRDSQLAAWASQQSHILQSREELDSAFDDMKNRFADGDIPLPEFWGGYRVQASLFEFWQGRANRLHDSFSYTLNETQDWIISRLAP